MLSDVPSGRMRRMGTARRWGRQQQVDMTVFVVDDHEAARDALTFLLRTDGLTCRSYASAAAFLEQLRPEHAGCLITDFRMPGMDGVALVSRLRETGCRIPVIMMTGHADVPLAIQAMKAGVEDLIEKPFKSDDIRRAVHRCLELARGAAAAEARRVSIERNLTRLTERERQVLAGVLEGWSNKEVALNLGISPRTVEIYRANLMAKMQAENLAELVRMTSAVSID